MKKLAEEAIKYRHITPAGSLAAKQTQRMPVEAAQLFGQIAGNAQLFRKLGQML